MALKSRAQIDHLTLIEGQSAVPRDREFETIDQLCSRVRQLLLYDRVEYSKIQPFFWSLVEAYYDRFQLYPFDVSKALFSYLELHEYPEEETGKLVELLEKRFLEQHGRPLRKKAEATIEPGSMESEIKELRDSLKYASLLDEI